MRERLRHSTDSGARQKMGMRFAWRTKSMASAFSCGLSVGEEIRGYKGGRCVGIVMAIAMPHGTNLTEQIQ
jgi:hypothetical protein